MGGAALGASCDGGGCPCWSGAVPRAALGMVGGAYFWGCGNRLGFGRKLAKCKRALAAYRAHGVRDLRGFARSV
jgi:hypothetical protein